MPRLSKENLDFILKKNKIPLEEVFDATGLRRKDYLPIMENNGYRLAYGVNNLHRIWAYIKSKKW